MQAHLTELTKFIGANVRARTSVSTRRCDEARATAARRWPLSHLLSLDGYCRSDRQHIQ